MKDFELKDADNIVKKRSNKKLQQEAVERIKETGHVSASDYLQVTNPKKKNNSIKEVEPQLVKAKEENHLGVPSTFYLLTPQEQSMLMFYLSSDFVHPVTNKRTHMNILQSYIAAYVEDDEIGKVWELKEDEHGNRKLGRIKNAKKYAELQTLAIQRFNQNPVMMEAWNDLIRLTFGANPEDMIRNAIMTDAIYAENAADKNANRRMAIDILSLGQDKQNQSINIFLDGGGKELAEVYKNDDYIVTIDDLDV
jgi:uncharacterized protein YqeY